MNNLPQHPSLCEQLLTFNRLAFDYAQYKVAYHCLAAALYCALDVLDLEQLQMIKRTAIRQSVWMIANAPISWRSSLQVAQGHGSDLFSVLAHEAEIHLQWLRSQHGSDDPS